MSCIINTIRYDKKNTAFFNQQFDCPISINIIKELIKIETTQWRKFCFPPFNSLSKFILANTDLYPLLKPYITTTCEPFDFSYQYIVDISKLSKTTCSKNISTDENQFYAEKWFVSDCLSGEKLCFFELEHTKA